MSPMDCFVVKSKDKNVYIGKSYCEGRVQGFTNIESLQEAELFKSKEKAREALEVAMTSFLSLFRGKNKGMTAHQRVQRIKDEMESYEIIPFHLVIRNLEQQILKSKRHKL